MGGASACKESDVREFLYAVRAEPEGPLLVASNLAGFILVIWLLAIA